MCLGLSVSEHLGAGVGVSVSVFRCVHVKLCGYESECVYM